MFRKKITTTLVCLISLITVGLYSSPVLAAASTAASPKDQICNGIGAVTGSKGCQGQPGTHSIDDILKLVLNVLTFLVGFIAIIMLIIGGLKYILSQGDSTQTASAKNTILYAIVGLVIVAVAQIIVKFVIGKVG